MSDGLAREGFDKDLAFGESRESAFVQAITRARVEVKSDQKARSTGNVFIEYRQKGRPSGIATSEAEWWAIEVDDDVFITVRRSKLKALARQAIATGKHTAGGDFDEYDGALVPVVWLVQPWRPT
jgi:hypothetical protein